MKRGKTRVTHTLSVGKQEQMIAMLTSRLLQMEARGLSQEMSVDTETAYSELKRRIETIHVLA